MSIDESTLSSLAELTPRELHELHGRIRHAKLHAEETAKHATLPVPALTADEQAAVFAYLEDAGGVEDDADLRLTVKQAVYDRNWAALWPEMLHLLKCYFKLRGNTVPIPGGGVIHAGVGAAPQRLPIERIP